MLRLKGAVLTVLATLDWRVKPSLPVLFPLWQMQTISAMSLLCPHLSPFTPLLYWGQRWNPVSLKGEHKFYH